MTRPGYLVEERYRLDKRIAAGGVGQVWRAMDLLLARPVAVKVLRPEYADHPDTLERFRKEARNAGLLTHPHLAQVFDYGPGGPGCPPYLVMEFVDGPSLADILAGGPVAPVAALDLVAQTADGLSAAHRAGLVHRDIKPGNILIGPDGQVKVTDFGIAHAAGQAPVTGPGLVMGTAQYMAPERIAGGQGTPASDLYALGIVLHECLAGVPPFEGSSAEVMAAHLYLPLPPLPAGVPAEVDALVGRLAVKDPARRISDAGDLAELATRLRDALAPGYLVPSASGLHHGAGGAVADPARRRRTGAIAAGAAVLTGTALGALLISGAFRTASPDGPSPTNSTSATTTLPGARPSPGNGPAGASSRGPRAGPSPAAVPGATSPRAAGSSTKAPPSKSPSSPSSSPSTSPSGSPSTSPSGSPSGPPSPSPSSSGSSCVLGICL